MNSLKFNGLTATSRSNWSSPSALKQPYTLRPSSSSFPLNSLLPSSTVNVMLSCAFHKGEKLTNFCKNKGCLLPLCPKCIKTHLQQHQSMGIFGSISTIDEVVEQAQTFIGSSRVKLQEWSIQIADQKDLFSDKISTQTQKLNEARQTLHELIDTTFDGYQTSWLEYMNQINKQSFEGITECEELIGHFGKHIQFIQKRLNTKSGILQGAIHYLKELQELNLTSIESLLKHQLKVMDIDVMESELEAVIQTIGGYVKFNQGLKSKREYGRYKQFTQFLSPSDRYKSNKNIKTNLQQIEESKYIKSNIMINDKPEPHLKSQKSLQTFISPLDTFSLQKSRQKK